MLDHDMSEPMSTALLDLGDYFTFGDPILGPYGNEMSSQTRADSNIDYLQPLQNIDPALTVERPAGTAESASNQITTVAGTANDRPDESIEESFYNTDGSMVIDSGSADTESRSRLSTLTLENVHPQTVNLVLNTLLSSNASFQMRLDKT